MQAATACFKLVTFAKLLSSQVFSKRSKRTEISDSEKPVKCWDKYIKVSWVSIDK